MLQIERLSKYYGDRAAVKDLSLTISPGEICAFIGHNGAGKTTTLRAACGLLRFDAGEIRVNGISIRENPLACKRALSYIPDTPDLYAYLTGVKYLSFVADIYGVGARDRAERIEKYAALFGLQDDLAQPISSYSHGMKQKLAIISALLHAPKLILMDEPFVGLDPIAAHNLKTVMREHCDAGGAIFFSTHVLEVAEKLCDKVAIIRHGALVASGTMETIRGDHSLEDVFLELSRETEGV
ncbi:MAG: ABC transporter ATP-binding protein [Clostridia bacterium]|nr:ABC transporter ATP-binding protein [Clostridia bacterium]